MTPASSQTDGSAVDVVAGRPTADGNWQLAAGGIAVGLFEGWLVYAVATGALGVAVLAIAHVVAVGLIGAWVFLRARAGHDVSIASILCLAVAAAGPVGALAGLIIMLGARRDEDPGLLRDWYERIAMAVSTDRTTQLCEQVETGRTLTLTGVAPPSFTAVMEHGSLGDRQAALGIIARNFDPDFLPALSLALKSPEPIIRVQAAAVATRVRSDLRRLLDRLATDTGDGEMGKRESSLQRLTQLEEALASGLLDEGDRIRADVLAHRLRTDLASNRVRTSLAAVPLLLRDAAELQLIEARQFAALRVGRRIAAICDAGGYRVRRVRRREIAA